MLAKCPLAKCPLTKCPLTKCLLAKCPLAKCPLAKCQLTKCPLAKRPLLNVRWLFVWIPSNPYYVVIGVLMLMLWMFYGHFMAPL